MKILILGTNGMVSEALTKWFYAKADSVDVYGRTAPNNYDYTHYTHCDLLKDKLDYRKFLQYDVIIYAAGAGGQSALSTPSLLMYQLNVYLPIEITLGLKSVGYNGIYVSFGSYMEIGVNNEEDKEFDEESVVCSTLPVTNDYALSKRIYGRYMRDFEAEYKHYHFILPNMFSEEDRKPGTRLVPYTFHYLQEYNMGKHPESPSFSAGLQMRQFITLEEMILSVDKAITAQIPSGIYNVGGGEYLSIRQLVERLFAIYSVPVYDEYFGKEAHRDGDIKFLCIDGSKLKKSIDYMPSLKIEDIFKTNK